MSYTLITYEYGEVVRHNDGTNLYMRRSGGDWTLYDFADALSWMVAGDCIRSAPIDAKAVAKIAFETGDF